MTAFVQRQVKGNEINLDLVQLFLEIQVGSPIPIPVAVENRSENLGPLAENGNEGPMTGLDLDFGLEKGREVWTYVHLGVEKVGENKGPGWWEGLCSVSEPRPLF
jgi:hypothetical protein